MSINERKLSKRIADWIIKECCDDAGKSEDDYIEVPAVDLVKILIDGATDGQINPNDYSWMKPQEHVEPIEVACAKALGVELNEEFFKAYNEAQKEAIEGICKYIGERAALGIMEKDPKAPLN